jgi:RNA-binding protein
MFPLKGFQRRYLRGQANRLKPVVFIGKNGVNDDVLAALNEALDSHELIKVKFHEYKEERKVIAADIAQECDCEIAGIIGHTAIFYRQNPNKEKQIIKLPQRNDS